MRNAKAMQTKSRTHVVVELAEGAYDVISGSSGTLYWVVVTAAGDAVCSCNWGKYRPAGDPRCVCSHVIAVQHHRARNDGRRAYAWDRPEDAARQRKPILTPGDGVTLTFSRAS